MLAAMALDLEEPRTARIHAALSPFLRGALERSAAHALHLHADAVSIEHLLTVLLLDEDSAAHRAVLFAFADPESLVEETLALSPGILVVGSGSSLPFSTAGVRGLRAARAGRSAVGVEHLLAGALRSCTDDVRAALAGAGLAEGALPPGGGQDDVPEGRSLFADCEATALRALGAACRIARGLGRSSIAPGHIVQACLESDPELARRTGLSGHAARRALAGRDADEEPPPERALALEAELAPLLEGLRPEAGSLGLLAAVVARGPDELARMLSRNRVTPELLARAGDAFADPA